MLLCVTSVPLTRVPSAAAPTLSVEVVLASVAFVVGAVSAAVAAQFNDAGTGTEVLAMLGGWPLLALAGAVVLDRRPGHPVGRLLAVLGTTPLLVVLWAVPAPSSPLDPLVLGEVVARSVALFVVAVGVGLPWALLGRLPAPGPVALPVAGFGGLAVAVGYDAGWVLVAVGGAASYAGLAAAARRSRRDDRRRLAWLLLTLASSGVALSVMSWGLPGALPTATLVALLLVAATTARLVLGEELRPLADHGTDVALAVAALVLALTVALVVGAASAAAGLPAPGPTAAFSGLVALLAAVPAGRSVHRDRLDRRYGTGTLSADDVAVITADLHRQTDPRELLDKAARMVAEASGSLGARIELDDDPEPGPAWLAHPLVVGGDRLGTLLVRSADDEGPEPRQRRVVAQLLPTVALVARAVGLAVEAQHARLDVARERDAERARILRDLHDGLGPALAGMSMRVQAARRTRATAHDALLDDLATDLARSRTDLRGLVAGLTPSALDEADLAEALRRLVRSFETPGAEPRLTLRMTLDHPLDGETQVVAYRTVAEGVTNALRHAAPTHVEVCVASSGDGLVAQVVDDGRGGRVVPGVGLASLRQRAEALGGSLAVETSATGTRLRLAVPR